MARFTRILCPIDFSAASRHALKSAVKVCNRARGAITLCHVFRPATQELGELDEPFFADLRGKAERMLQTWRADAQQQLVAGTGRVTIQLVDGLAAEQIVALAETGGFDLIVMATNREHGSVGEAVARDAPCPVLLMHHKALPDQVGS
jgi:nucleotide-binding universal stress UspA family protein